MTAVRPDPLAADDGLARFVSAVECAERRSRRQHALLRAAAPLLVAVALALWWSLAVAAWIAGAAALWLLWRLSAVDVRGARHGGLLRLQPDAARLRDELVAWDEARASGAARPLLPWLALDLADAVSAAPSPRRWLPVRRLGRARYLLPIAVVLLLVWLCLPTLSVPGLGGGSGRSGGRGKGEGGGAGGGAAVAAGVAGGRPLRSPPSAANRSGDPPPTPPPSPPSPKQRPPTPEPPAPLLDLPSVPTVVVPEFTRDGATRRELAERALAGRDQEAGAASSSGTATAAPPPGADDFQRAAERALASRHVPPDERAIVRRFFELLQQPAAGGAKGK